MQARIRLLLPELEGTANRPWGSGGGGFGWCEVAYSVNPVGSKSLYKLEQVKHNDLEMDLETIRRLNPEDCVDEAIGKKFKDYAKEVQQQPITKRTKKKKPEPPKEDEGQANFELPDL